MSANEQDGYAITEAEAQWLGELVKRFEVRSALEFGPGRSTQALLEAGCDVVSVEDREIFWAAAKKTRELGDASLWLFTSLPNLIERIGLRRFDLAFIDGPHGTPRFSRLQQALVASWFAPLLALHDTKRNGERETVDVLRSMSWKTVESFDEGNGMLVLSRPFA